MATPGRLAALPLSQRRAPQRFELLQALLLLERERPQALPLGTGNAPRAEALRLRGPLLPLFASSEVESLLDDPQQPVLSTPVFGLGGPDGPLPYAYQEWLQQRARQKDHAPPSSSTCSSTACSACSTGYCASIAWRSVSRCRRRPRCRRSYAPSAACCRKPCKSAWRCRTARCWHAPRCSPAGVAPGRLRRPGAPALRRGGTAGRLPGRLEGNPAASRSRLQRGGRNLRLGRDAIAGTRTWDEHAGIALSLGPLDAREAARFFPDGDAHGQLASLAALYFGPDLDCRLSLLVSGGALRLERGAPPRLSWNTGLQRVEDGQRQRIDLDLRQPEVA